MAIAYAPKVTKKYNADICKQLGITPPDGYEAIETEE
jgi:putative ABC transport system substrate-binding protein